MDVFPSVSLDDEGREVCSSAPLAIHVPFSTGRTLTVFDRLRLRQLELFGALQSDVDSDGSFSPFDEVDDDFFDRPTPAELAELAASSASEPEQATPAPVKEEPPQDAADES